jgi:UDPglucose--hexose-1-phosphate uridylyltransferase
MTFRTHPLTKEPILFAPERAARPGAFGDGSEGRCPFCPGNESDTPPELARIGDPWRVRGFPNKYPPVEGAEVLVESPRHEDGFGDVAHGEDVVALYVSRYAAHRGSEWVSLFKNEGAKAGASIPHVHSQLIPLPFVPPRVTRELAGFAKSCPLCEPRGSVIRETESFLWLAPEASGMAYQQWIVPRRHVAQLTDLTDRELAELAALLRDAARAMRAIGPAFNWMFMSFPHGSAGHLYVDLFPRLAVIAGFELGTGTFVEIIDPAAAAVRLRETT